LSLLNTEGKIVEHTTQSLKADLRYNIRLRCQPCLSGFRVEVKLQSLSCKLALCQLHL
jgi:hypothetical protein